MENEIHVTMFGKFTIDGPGLVRPRVISLTGRSKRLWTLVAYLILHRDRGVPAEELIDTFWHDSEGLNPVSTLQNNISRARNALEELGLEDGKRLIHNNSGTYFWAPNKKTVVDCEQFMEKAEEVKACPHRDTAVEKALEGIRLYTADFLPESTGEGWCMGLAPRYREVYMNLCRSSAEYLVEVGRYKEAMEICTRVTQLEPMAEDFGVLYMHALALAGQPQKALDFYEAFVRQLEETYGIAPTAQLETERLLAREKLDGGVDREQVVDFLKTESRQEGAFQCDSVVFREIVNRHLRDMRRSGTPAQILVYRLENAEASQEEQAIYMRQLEEVLSHSLRAGDPFTRGGMELMLALLPGASGENGPAIVERIENSFRREYPQSGARFDVQILDLGTMGKAWEAQGKE